MLVTSSNPRRIDRPKADVVSPRPADIQILTDDTELTQYGEHGQEFRNSLREEIGELDLSLILGRQTAMAAALLVTKTVPPVAAARYTTAGALRRRGFVVKHSPTKGSPLHVSVFPPQGEVGPVEWDTSLAKAFDECFTGAGEDHAHG
ncbi:hypothetical protein Pen02_00750 [Plantactinospora endophytica]|uniref:LysR substrate-binding domain-containing protein n=1 Tax=Plantactinospora endophytica TaxID=673535 RepID=A0ABQ4DRR1_9ACTN|nr:hypothetical protein Pen02_00750 [Plantactinospora endophytica]